MKSKWLLLSIALGMLLSVGLLTTLTVHAGVTAHAPEAQLAHNTAYVVVRFGDHDTLVRPITFTEPISAYHALELSGLNFSTADHGWGQFLCSIEEVGDGSGTCDNGDRYWATYHWDADAWAGRMVGIADTMITQTGHIESFSWSDPDWSAVEPPPAPALVAAQHGLGWLLDQQQADGGYGTPGNTAEVLIALGANRQTPAPDTLATMLNNGQTLAATAGGAGKLALALTPHDTCWPFAVRQPIDHYDPATGTFESGAAPHALAMLGTAALGQSIPPTATTYLLAQQQPDGGWEWGIGWDTDTNSTSLALQALIAAGEPLTSTAIISGLHYLEQAQNTDGGFPYSPTSPWGTESDTNSTSYVVQALLATGQDPLTGTWAISGTQPIAFLLGAQLPDGSFKWQPGLGANQGATQQAITALLYRPFPVRAATLAPCAPAATIYLPLVQRD